MISHGENVTKPGHRWAGLSGIVAQSCKSILSGKRTPLWLLSYAAIAISACSDAAGPSHPAEATTLAAVSATALTGDAGSFVNEPPAVIVRNSDGNPVSGVLVTFAVTAGEGSLDGPVVRSNSQGIAKVTSWRLGYTAGLNIVSASSGPLVAVTFQATGHAGPVAQLVKYSGDGQTGTPGRAVSVNPSVRVVDAYNNKIAGATVTFSVAKGGGSLTGATAVSDPAGVATVGSWTLGGPGEQSVSVSAGSQASQVFTAFAILTAAGCDVSVRIPEGFNIETELTGQSCMSADGRFMNLFSVTLTQPTAYLFSASSTQFNTYLELRASDGSPIGSNDDQASGTTDSRVKAVLPPGFYTVALSSANPGATGRYSLQYLPTSPGVENCEEAFVVRGISINDVVTGSCRISDGVNVDKFRIYLKTGTSLEIEVEDLNYSGPEIALVTPAGTLVRGYVVGGYKMGLTYNSTADGYYTVLTGLVNDTNAQYRMVLR